MPANLLIFGSGRSGTSLAAGLFRDSGLHQGEDFHASDEANPKGYFEDVDVNMLNEDLLDPFFGVGPASPVGKYLFPFRLTYGYRWLAELPLCHTPSAEDGEAERIQAFTDAAPFCYKDPRFAYTFSAWEPYLPKDTTNLVVFRDPGETLNSLQAEAQRVGAKYPFTEEDAMRNWTSVYTHILLKQWDGDDGWLFVRYRDLFDDEVYDVLEDEVGVEVDRDFADPSLNRQPTEEIDNAGMQALWEGLMEAREATLGEAAT